MLSASCEIQNFGLIGGIKNMGETDDISASMSQGCPVESGDNTFFEVTLWVSMINRGLLSGRYVGGIEEPLLRIKGR